MLSWTQWAETSQNSPGAWSKGCMTWIPTFVCSWMTIILLFNYIMYISTCPTEPIVSSWNPTQKLTEFKYHTNLYYDSGRDREIWTCFRSFTQGRKDEFCTIFSQKTQPFQSSYFQFMLSLSKGRRKKMSSSFIHFPQSSGWLGFPFYGSLHNKSSCSSSWISAADFYFGCKLFLKSQYVI